MYNDPLNMTVKWSDTSRHGNILISGDIGLLGLRWVNTKSCILQLL